MHQENSTELVIAMAQRNPASTKPLAADTEEFDVFVERDVPVEMRDGVKLVADVHRPARRGVPVEDRFPVILIRTSYNKDNAQKQLDYESFVRWGYVVVIQDVRGRYKSGGSHYHGVAEAEDGYDTIEWIALRPWSNGRVGMTGISYLGAVQAAAAAINPPHLASVFHVKAPANYYQNGFRHHGTFLMHTLPIAFMLAGSSKLALEDPVLRKAAHDPWRKSSEWLSRMPLKRGLTPFSPDAETERWFFDVMTETDYSDFWKKVPLWQPEEFFDDYKDIPGYYVAGWYDLYREEVFYTGLSKRKKSRIKLLMGPWTHMDWNRYAGEVDFGRDAEMSYDAYNAAQRNWFDATLRDRKTGSLTEPPVKIFVMGGGDGRRNSDGRLNHGGRWRIENDWPLPRTRYTNYYFHSGGTLSTTRPGDEAASSFVYDPKNPVPTVGGTSYFLSDRSELTAPFVPFGPYDQRENPEYFGCNTNLPLAARSDVLVFMTAPLAADTEVTGPISVRLWASSSAVDTDFTAKLIDVHPPNEDYPEGFAMNLSDSILRMRYRNGFEKAELMTPGEVYEFVIDMPPTSNLFRKGHRIRVDISSSNYPAYDPNPNTGGPYMMGGKSVIAENSIHVDTQHPSHIVLPVIPLD
ncbi:MAG: CocE/NonD family hydrolase [Bryobacterales bacterium]|nr:CocE/NonD family hydrolase [Bryobacterales bacterium]